MAPQCRLSMGAAVALYRVRPSFRRDWGAALKVQGATEGSGRGRK